MAVGVRKKRAKAKTKTKAKTRTKIRARAPKKRVPARLIVAIDGPAGSGKSTVTRLLASRLGYIHIDTGALYRGIALKAQQADIPFHDAERLGRLARQCHLEFRQIKTDSLAHLFLDGADVSAFIRTPEMSMGASTVSAHPQVRQALLGLQRSLGRKGGVVLEGRDIGTVVFPKAHVKFFLTASVDTRAKRRMLELEQKGVDLDFEEVRRQVIERDKGDSERAAAPLRKADDAIEVDTTGVEIPDVVARLASIVTARADGARRQK